MKKYFVFIFTLILLFILVNNKTYAQTHPHVYRRIDFIDFMDSEGWEIVSIGDTTFIVTGILNMSGIDTSIDINEAIELYAMMPSSLEKGTPDTWYQRYVFSTLTDNPEKVRLDISLHKTPYENWCLNTAMPCDGDNPDPTTLHLYMSQYFAGYYISNVPSPFKAEYKSIDFSETENWMITSINSNTFTTTTILELPDIVLNGDINEAIDMYTKLPLNLTKGTPHPMYQHYSFEPTNELGKVRLLISINKTYYENWCISNSFLCDGNNPNPLTLPLYMSQYFAGYYIIRLPIQVIEYDYPNVTMKLPFENLYQFMENEYTYEYLVWYRFDLSTPIPNTLNDNEYYMITNYHIPFTKGFHEYTNTYEFERVIRQTGLGYGIVEMRITLDKNFVDDEFGHMYNTTPFFRDNSVLYIKYFTNYDSIEYGLGYSDGYQDGENSGYNRGYDHGYTEGYMDGYFDGLDNADPLAYRRGYNDGYDDGLNAATSSFQSNLHVWIVPAIIIVVIAGIFVGYRRERYHD